MPNQDAVAFQRLQVCHTRRTTGVHRGLVPNICHKKRKVFLFAKGGPPLDRGRRCTKPVKPFSTLVHQTPHPCFAAVDDLSQELKGSVQSLPLGPILNQLWGLPSANIAGH